MKFFVSLLAIVLVVYTFSACHKSGGGMPVQQDTLLAWQKISTGAKWLIDLWFINPSTGIAVGDAVYKSTDGGKTWLKIPGLPSNGFNIHVLNGQRSAVLGAQAVYLTSDYTNWITKPLSIDKTGYDPDLQFTSLSTCYISSFGGLFKTTDTANTWAKTYSNPVNGMFFFDDNTGIIYDYSANASTNIYKTTDGGAHWQALSYIPGHANSYNTMQFVNSQAGWLNRGDSLFSTINGGAAWLGRKSPGGGITDIQFLDSRIGYMATSGEIFKTTDGGDTWTRSCKLANEQFVEIFFLDEKTGWACGGSGSILRLKL